MESAGEKNRRRESFREMNIIVSGCAGFIGSKVCESLLRRGDRVFGLDNMSDAYDVRLKRHRLEALSAETGFDFFLCDISDNFELLSVCEKIKNITDGGPIDCVINLAARAGVRQSIDNPWIYYSTNVTGTLNLLEFCRSEKINKFVLASTSSVYGKNDTPFYEEMKTDSPLSPYASSKKSAEGLCSVYNSLYGMDISILRYFTVYGPAGRPDMSVFRFIKWVEEGREIVTLGDGEQKRDFTYVEDVVAGTVAAIKNLGFEIINLGNSVAVSLNEVIEIIERKTGKKAEIIRAQEHSSDIRFTLARIEKAKRVLGWKPRFSLEEGIEKSVEWYRSNGDLARSIEV